MAAMLSAGAQRIHEFVTRRRQKERAAQRLEDEEALRELALDRTPSLAVELTQADVYGVLTRLRVIKQRGRLFGDLVEWDGESAWVHQKTRAGVDASELSRRGVAVAEALTDRHDVQPMSVIRVVGDIDFGSFVTSAEHRRFLEKRRIFDVLSKVEGVRRRMKLTFKTLPGDGVAEGEVDVEAGAGHGDEYDDLLAGSDDDQEVTTDELPPPSEDAEEYAAWSRRLQKHQISRFIKQYLQRSVPAAARMSGALIVVADTVTADPAHGDLRVGDISRALNKGMFASRCAADDGEKLQSGQSKADYFVSDSMLVGVHVWENDVCP